MAVIGDFNPYYATGVARLPPERLVHRVASLLTPPPSEDQVRALIYASIHQEAAAEIKANGTSATAHGRGLLLRAGEVSVFTFGGLGGPGAAVAAGLTGRER
jgi:hypothetical protein